VPRQLTVNALPCGLFNNTPDRLNLNLDLNLYQIGICPPEMPPNERAEKQAAAQQAVDILHEIATILVSHSTPLGLE
jgi:hypothetical protein